MFFTSEANSHGVISKKWLDGKVEEVNIKRGKLQRLKISQITKHNYIGGRCTEQPYYDCLSSKLVEAGSTVCAQYGGFCKVASLPEPSGAIPNCSTLSSKNCSLNLFTEIMYHSQQCRREGDRLCTIIEYQRESYERPDARMFPWTSGMVDLGNSNNCSIEYQLMRPSSSRGTRDQHPYQLVATENLVWSSLQFVVNLGGVLSFTMGFSFSSTAHWIMSTLISLVRFHENSSKITWR